MDSINKKLVAHDLILKVNQNTNTLKFMGASLIFTYLASFLNLTLQAIMIIGVILAFKYYENEKEIKRLKVQYLE